MGQKQNHKQNERSKNSKYDKFCIKKKNEVDKNNRPITVTYRTVNNILRAYYSKPRKVRKVFFLTEEQMQKRFSFCQQILDKKISYKEIMFTDECKIDLSPYTNDLIRLDPEDKEKLKNGESQAYNLINRPQKKFEKSLIIAGGVSFYGTSKLLFLDGTMNDFSYGQTLLFYK